MGSRGICTVKLVTQNYVGDIGYVYLQMIEDFTDVNRGEKELMKLWNLYAMENSLIADKQVPIHCLKFAQEQRQTIKDKGIVHNFMAHLISLCDYGLIPPRVIGTSMAIIFGGTS